MFTQRNRRDKPLEKFQEYLDGIIWPASVTRLPNNVRTVSLSRYVTDAM